MVIIELESLNLTHECLLSIKYGFSNHWIDSIFDHMFYNFNFNSYFWIRTSKS